MSLPGQGLVLALQLQLAWFTIFLLAVYGVRISISTFSVLGGHLLSDFCCRTAPSGCWAYFRRLSGVSGNKLAEQWPEGRNGVRQCGKFVFCIVNLYNSLPISVIKENSI